MTISIITVVYNNAAFIEQCIKSVLSQTYQHIEYIIVDGGSTDGTRQIIEKHRQQISKYISESDGGMYYALNKGINLANGEVIGIITGLINPSGQDVFIGIGFAVPIAAAGRAVGSPLY